MDLIRLLLFEVEDEKEVDLSNYTEEEIVYNKALLIRKKFCRGSVAKDSHGKVDAAHIISLEWEGHYFLDAARDNKIWEKVKKKIISTGTAFTISIILEMLKKELRNKFGLSRE